MSFCQCKYWTVFISLIFICMAFVGCTHIKPYRAIEGDTLLADYTCFLENGEIASTTVRQIAEDTTQKKSVVFVKRDSFGPIEIKVGEEEDCKDYKKNKELDQFETVLKNLMSQAVVGLSIGEPHRVELRATERKDVRESERIISLARVRKAPKELRMDRDQYVLQMKKKPEVDQHVDFYYPLEGKVMSVKESEVVIGFTPASEEFVEGPFGKIRVKDRGDHFELETMAQKGRLVRTGPIVGRIAEVGDTSFTLDYGHPFGGQKLICDVRLEKRKDI